MRDPMFDEEIISESEVLFLIRKDIVLKRHFFNSLGNSRFVNEWYTVLLREDFFDIKYNPVPIKNSNGTYSVDDWPALTLLEKVLDNEHLNRETMVSIKEVLLSLIHQIISNDEEVGNYRTNASILLCAFKLPEELFEITFIEFFEYVFDSGWNSILVHQDLPKKFIPHLGSFKNTLFLHRLIQIIVEFTISEDGNERPKAKIEEYYFNKISDGLTPLISEKLGASILLTLVQIIEDSYKVYPYSFIFLRSIHQFENDDEKNLIGSYAELVAYFTKRIIDNIRKKDIIDAVYVFRNIDIDILVKLKIYFFDVHYESVKEVFWEWFQTQDAPIFDDLLYLFVNHSKDFENNQIDLVINWIENLEIHSIDQANEKTVSEAYLRRRWLLSLKENKSKKINDRISFYERINSEPVELISESPPFLSITSHREKTPFNSDEIEKMGVEELVGKANSFVPETGFGNSTKRGLANTIRTDIENNPKKYVKNFGLVLELDIEYLEVVFVALKSAWENNKKFNFKEVLDQTSKWVELVNLTEEKYTDRRIIIDIADLIVSGTKSDDSAFSISYLNIAENLLLSLIRHEPPIPSVRNNQENYYSVASSVLNSPLGSIYSALINVALRYARIKQPKKAIRWKTKIKKVFEEKLNSSNTETEFYFSLGKYLVNIIYLDEEWINANFQKIFPLDDQIKWELSISGYLFYTRAIEESVYTLMRERGNYIRAIQHDFGSNELNAKPVQHVSVAYLNDLETSLEDSPLNQVFELKLFNPLQELIRFISLVKNIDQIDNNKFRSIWKKIYQSINDDSDKELQHLKVSTLTWVKFFPKIDEEIKRWIIEALQFIGPHSHDLWRLIDLLSELVDKQPNEVGEILIKLLRTGNLPDSDDKIREIVTKLFQNEDEKVQRLGIRICSRYRALGSTLLTDLYEEFSNE